MKSSVLFLATAMALTAVQATAAAVEDTDGNGTYSFAEVSATNADISEEAFADMDTDQSGELSAEELDAAHANGLLAE